MAITIVLDTNIILLQLGGRLAEEIPRGRFFVWAISEIELLSYHSLSNDEESLVGQFLSEMTIVDLNAAVKAETIRIRKEYRLKIPDAIVAATALVLNAELCSNDPVFHRIKNLRCSSLRIK